jgi:protein TonB
MTSRPTARSKAAIPAAATPLPALTPGVGVPTAVPAGLTIPTPAVTSVPAGYDPKAVEAEVQRQLAAKKKELQKTLEPSPAPGGKAARETAAAPAVPAKEEPTPPAETPATKSEPAPAAEPTAVATRPPLPTEAPARSAPVKESEVSRGDLVGPGPGVVEPALVSSPRVSYPPLARRQRVSGRVIVLVLVDENGNVSDARLQQGVLSKLGVNEAVLEAVRKSKFRSATKSGVPVKMWRTVVVDVQP